MLLCTSHSGGSNYLFVFQVRPKELPSGHASSDSPQNTYKNEGEARW